MPTYSQDCLNILRLLKTYKNVVLLAPPACGKTRLLREVSEAFIHGFMSIATPSNPLYVQDAEVAFPKTVPVAGGAIPISELPSPKRGNRKSFPTVFHAGSKQHQFLSGLVPDVASGAPTFRVAHGTLVQANAHAKSDSGAALVLVDELNRGPAVELFGDALVALEKDKRLLEDDSEGPQTWPIQVLMKDGTRVCEPLSAHLYVLVAMNQADASVQPIDVAFLRRFQPYRLEPRPDVVRAAFKTPGASHDLSAVPSTAHEVVECAIRAWTWVNRQITLGRGKDYQLGHGVFFGAGFGEITDIGEAKSRALIWWSVIYAHLEEVFFADQFSLATAVGASEAGGLYRLEPIAFGAEQRHELKTTEPLDESNVYEHLHWLAQKVM